MKKPASKPSIPVNAHALPELAGEVSLRRVRPPSGLLSRFREWIQSRRLARSSDRRLRVAETVSLGEKRFVAVVQVDGRHFLLAGGPANIVLLAQLHAKDDFQEVLKKTMTVPVNPPAKRKQTPRPARPLRSSGTDLSQKNSGINAGKFQSKRTGKRSPSPSAQARAPLPAALHPTAAFGDSLNSIPAPGQLAKPAARQNGKYTPGHTEEYA